MIDVVMNDGRILRYNVVEVVDSSDGILRLNMKNNDVVAQFPWGLVERIETNPPCKIMRDQRNKRKIPLR